MTIRQRRWIQFGALIVGIALTARIGVAVARPLVAEAMENRELSVRVTAETQMTNARAVADSAAAADLDAVLTSRLLGASTRVQAQAALASQVETITSDAGLALKRLTAIALSDTVAPLARAGIQLEADGDYESIEALLADIRTNQCMLRIERFALHANRSNREAPLGVTMVIHGLFRSDQNSRNE